MSWFKVDDKLHSHPKFLKAGLEAMGLWLAAGSYSADYGTGGRVDLRAISRLSGDVRRAKSLASRLVLAGLWRTIEADVWMFHDWNVHNYSEEEEAEKKANRRASGRLGGLSTAEKKRVQALANATALAETLLPYAGKQKPTPSRSRPDPDPSALKKEQSQSAADAPPATDPVTKVRRKTTSAGTRLPEGWTPRPETIRRFAKREGVDATAAIEPFCLYWQAKAGAGATKLDWEKTFTTWVLRDLGRLPPAPIERAPPEPFIHPEAVPMPPEFAAALQALHDKPSALDYLGEKK